MGQKNSISKRLDSIERKLSTVVKIQKDLLHEQQKSFTSIQKSETKLEESIEENELTGPSIAKNEVQELAELKTLENSLKKNLQESPLKRITYKDVTKGMVGAAFAIIGDFAFADGFRLAEHYTLTRSLLLLVTSFFIIVLFIYFTGFRRVNDKFVFKFLPIRAIILYVSALIVCVSVLFLFDTISFSTPWDVALGTVSSISVLAVLGAGTADLIGKKCDEMTIHRHVAFLLKDELTIEDLTNHFITLVRESILPFIKKLEDMYYSKVDITLDEQKHLQELKDVVLRYLQFEARILERIHNRELAKCLEREIAEVRKITQDISSFKLDGLQKDFEELLCVLDLMHKCIQKALKKIG